MKGFNNSRCRRQFMARPHTRLALLLVLSMLMAGCVYSSTPEWGSGDGQLNVDIEEGSAIIQSQLGDGFDSSVAFGCNGTKTKVTGMLISSAIYDTHPDIDGIESAMGAAVIIHTMKWSEAEAVEEGSAGRVNLKDWSSPVNPTEAVGSKLSENEDDWEVIGIIPGSENIADGLNVLEHWHQPIELSGYILDTDNVATVSESCELEDQGHGMVVTKIRTEEGIVSMDGDHDDEYSLGDTDIFGGWTFILFFLIVGIGGGVGLFIVSTMVIRQGAKATAEALLGREGFAKAVQMKKDLKSSKKAGLESAEDRAKKEQKSRTPPKKSSQKKEELIPGFSLDSVLSSSSEDEAPATFGGGGSVVVTSEAKQMQSQPVVTSTPVKVDSTPMPSTNVVSSQPETPKRGHFSASMSSSQSSSRTSTSNPVKDKPVKRRAVKKRAATPDPVPEVKEKRASITDDDDFSDFSF
jgi:hypothetical protein